MKRIITIAALALVSVLASAVPADKTKFLYRQPDGTTIVLQRHGDEYYHWTTDSRGRRVEINEKGFYVNSPVSDATHRANIMKASGQKRAWSSYENPPVTNFGDRKVLCIIANFSDSTFVIDNPRASFDAMLNQPGYSFNNAIGSVRDYYIDNSKGQYRPSFDVYGPVTLSGSSAHYDNYDGSGGSVHEAIFEAYELLKDQINIDDYDTDNDGNVDMVLFYYPGHNEAEGAGPESIWPHQSTANFGSMGGKNLVRYFCTSELRGSKGNTMCPIGTTCHEFAHSLGIPDTYDTDYEGSGGYNKNTPDEYDLMDFGSYNDSGRRPPYLTAMERNMLGWMDYPQEIAQSGDYVLEPVNQNKAYMSSSKTSGEFFIYEYRTKSGWDSSLSEAGLLVYHVDKSGRTVPGSNYTAENLWKYTNKINAFYGHPCFYLIQSTSDSVVFPGPGHVSSVSPTAWDGQNIGLYITGISENGGKLYFKASFEEEGRKILGTVMDYAGNPVSGARVVLSKAAYEFQAPSLLSTDVVTYSDHTGTYEFKLPSDFASIGILTASAEGFVPLSVNVQINDRFTGYDFMMLSLQEDVLHSLSRYNTESTAYVFNFGLSDVILAMRYPAEDAAEYAGGKLASVSFAACAEIYTDAYVIVDFGQERVLTKNITSEYYPGHMITIDLSSENLVIPTGKDVFIGFGFTGLDTSDSSNSFYVCNSDTDNNGNYFSVDVTSGPTTWRTYSFSGKYYIPPLVATVGVPLNPDFSMFGVSYIAVENNVPVVYAAAGKTVRDVKWTLDGGSVASPPEVTSLSGGTHTYVASIVFYDGTAERVIYDYVK